MSNAPVNAPSLFNTKDYAVVIGSSPFVEPFEGNEIAPQAYLVLNKNTGIVEAEHRILGMAMRMCKEAQDALDRESSTQPMNKEAAMAEMPELAPVPTPPAPVAQ